MLNLENQLSFFEERKKKGQVFKVKCPSAARVTSATTIVFGLERVPLPPALSTDLCLRIESFLPIELFPCCSY